MISTYANLDDLGVEQRRLLHKAGEFLHERAQRGVDVATDPECYLNSWAGAPGFARLHRLAFGWRAEPERLIARSKDFFRRVTLAGFDVTRSAGGAADADTLIVSWSRASDFNDGVYSDRYFRVSSDRTRRTIWFLIALDDMVPRRVPQNVRLFHRRQSGAQTASDSQRSTTAQMPAGLRRSSSATVTIAGLVAAAIANELSRGRFRTVLVPYEAQPFQHAVNLAVKAHDSNIATLGYLHSALPALPTDLTYRAGAPDLLFVHGRGQREILVDDLGWPAERVRVIPSLRYRRDDAAPLESHILLPYAFRDGAVLLAAFEEFLKNAAPASLPVWVIRNHPVMAASRRHLALVAGLTRLCERYSDRMSGCAAERQSVVLGASAAVIEALERGLDVVHLCGNPLFETHTPTIWTHLHVDEIAPHAYRYRLRERGSYVELGDGNAPAVAQLGIQ